MEKLTYEFSPLNMYFLIPILLYYYQIIQQGNATPEIIKDYMVVEALVMGVDPQVAIGIVEKESGFNCEAEGDGGKSHGCWQIYQPSHPSITIEQAKDPIFSTQWSLRIIKKDGCGIWSTCKATMKELAVDS